jgi:uncharacterized protein (TIGR03067 family)
MEMSTLLMVLAVWGSPSLTPDDNGKGNGLEGKWVLADGRANGQRLPEGTRGHVRLMVIADEMILYADSGRGSRFVCKLDAQPTPNLVDLVGISGMDKGKNLLGIYELSGDRLKVCRTLNPTITRPKEFTAEAGSKCVVEEWRREKDEYTAAEDRMRLTGRWRVAQNAAEPKARLRDLAFADPQLNVTFEQGGQQLGFESGPWRLEEAVGVRKIVGPSGTCTYRFDKGRLELDFAEGRFKGKWTLTRARTP